MGDSGYDAVIIGGGHQGLILACYLQNAGMQTVIFERRGKLGGPVHSDSDLIPGFIVNPGANWTRFYSHPAYEDFNLRAKGLEYIYPEQGAGIIFDNETCIIGYPAWRVVDPATGETEFSEENAQKTFNEIARFSQRDADTAEELLRRYRERWHSAISEYRFAPPKPWGQKNELEKLCDDSENGIDPIYQFMTCQQIAYDLFESDEMRTFFMRAVMTSSACVPDDVIGLYSFIHTLGLILSWAPASIAVGGSQNITDALQQAFTEMGGEFFLGAEVDKVLIRNKAAVGIRTKDGTEVGAKKLVASDLSAYQTICQLLGEAHVGSQIARRVKNIRQNRGHGFWINFAVHELPEYKATNFNPDCGLQPRLYMGSRDPEYFANRYPAELLINGIASKLLLFAGSDSLWDRSRVPEGKHLFGVEDFTAPQRFFPADVWKQIMTERPNLIIKAWESYAPNMVRDNVIGTHLVSPGDLANNYLNMHAGSFACGDMIISQLDRFRPIPELSSYRMPVKNLYLCSSSAHPGPGTGRGNACCCYKVISEDFGLETIWEKIEQSRK